MWVALAGAPLAWWAQELAGWFVEGRACSDGRPEWGALSAGGVRAVEVGVGLVALAVAIACLYAGWRRWRARRGDAGVTRIQGRERADFVAAVVMLAGAVFTLGIAWNAAAYALLPLCGSAR